MRKIRCYECKKAYDYDEDAFCPWCGAFNQRNAAEGGARILEARDRVDGLNESGHSGSFLHREFHSEERQRRRQGLDQKKPKTVEHPNPSLVARKGTGKKKPLSPFVWVIIVIILLNIISAFEAIFSI